MLNQAIVVGRVSNYDLIEGSVTIAISRSFKNQNGEYEYDYIPVKLWKGVGSQLSLINIGDIIGIKGRLERTGVEIKVIGEKVTFLAPGKNGEVTNENESTTNDTRTNWFN